MCQISLLPAVHEIESLVKSHLINPLCSILNKRVESHIAKIHRGIYIESSGGNSGESSFVQDNLVVLYESISKDILSHVPSEYGAMIASNVATYSIYFFVTNASLVRPLGEMGRLRITQDLADFELTLEQLLLKAGESLSQIGGGKPYAELRAVRQMLFWAGLENKELSAESAAKAFFREAWVKDVRPSTAFHFLFSFAPKLLSSPHHSNRMTADEYAKTLIKIDGSIEDGEARAWMSTITCCDAYQQRDSVDNTINDGDRRVPSILMIIGPELLRRRRL